jgi:hypothetical protein
MSDIQSWLLFVIMATVQICILKLLKKAAKEIQTKDFLRNIFGFHFQLF